MDTIHWEIYGNELLDVAIAPNATKKMMIKKKERRNRERGRERIVKIPYKWVEQLNDKEMNEKQQDE